MKVLLTPKWEPSDAPFSISSFDDELGRPCEAPSKRYLSTQYPTSLPEMKTIAMNALI